MPMVLKLNSQQAHTSVQIQLAIGPFIFYYILAVFFNDTAIMQQHYKSKINCMIHTFARMSTLLI